MCIPSPLSKINDHTDTRLLAGCSFDNGIKRTKLFYFLDYIIIYRTALPIDKFVYNCRSGYIRYRNRFTNALRPIYFLS